MVFREKVFCFCFCFVFFFNKRDKYGYSQLALLLSTLNTDVMIGSKKVVYNQTAVVDIPVMEQQKDTMNLSVKWYHEAATIPAFHCLHLEIKGENSNFLIA